ncbi:MAG: type III pantothenate kinase [Flavobacteriales bacterium]|jgi:type III pantothenate kinase|nr:type III pantothenate kinase [Flavobacteriales bacterium]MBP9159213.1 type III pantothenate kinase [Flavobacteriales bacterium]MCI1752224.1 type III pantothenate kinase [Flavobacteriales bacterium]
MEQEAVDLVVDVGNTRMKMGLFLRGKLLKRAAAPHGDRAEVARFLGGHGAARIALGSVAKVDPPFLAFLEGLAPVTVILPGSPTPVQTRYSTPETLGVDRMANAVGVAVLFPTRPALAIDLGTCITYDLVDALAVHHGGAISPGMAMRAKAMHAYSAALPEVLPPENPPLLGLDTPQSLAAGIHFGICAEMRAIIAELGQQQPGMAVVLTGGDAPRFAKAMKSGIFAHPSLTLIGLHAILHHHPRRGFVTPL